jgi:hypothetical protein
MPKFDEAEVRGRPVIATAPTALGPPDEMFKRRSEFAAWLRLTPLRSPRAVSIRSENALQPAF